MSKPEKPYNLNFKIKLVLAIIGSIIIIMSSKMSRHIYFNQDEIYNHLIYSVIGLILIIPLVLFMIKSKRN